MPFVSSSPLESEELQREADKVRERYDIKLSLMKLEAEKLALKLFHEALSH